LLTFDFEIVYRKWASNGKPDALSRRSELRPQEGGTTAADISTPFLKPGKYAETKQHTASLRATLPLDPEMPIELAGYEQAGGSEDNIYRNFSNIVLASLERVRFAWNFSTKVATDDEGYATMKAKCTPQDTESLSPHYTLDNDVLYYKYRLVVPTPRRKMVLEAEHDSKLVGYWGAGKTVEIVGRNFHWPNMDEQSQQYVHQCDFCQRNKLSRHPLKLPSAPGTSISMDIITEVPESEGCRTIWVVVDGFSKMAYLVALKGKTATGVAKQFINHIWKLHGLPDDIMLDRDTAFTSKSLKEVMNFLGVKERMSTAFGTRCVISLEDRLKR
jgi:hypothetical protein